MNKLSMTVGLPRSGKSTFCKSLNVPIVNPDSVRLALHGNAFIYDAEPMVWAITKYMVISLFIAGHTEVVLDATNTSVKRRDAWIDSRWARAFHVFNTTKETCIERAQESGRPDLVPIIEGMSEKFEPYTSNELKEWEL